MEREMRCCQNTPSQEAFDEELHLWTTAETGAKYGSTENSVDQARRWVERSTSSLYKVAMFVCVAFVLLNVIRRVADHFHKHEIPRLTCEHYRYPQCERAIIHYLEKGASHRCEAFERVKAEGDYWKYPYMVGNTARCFKPGCCSCPSQCSACPNVLVECTSWRLDGEWKVVFNDGSSAKYIFDAKGHVEAELPSQALPKHQENYKIGDRVEATDKVGSDVTIRSATIEDLNDDGTYFIKWDDGSDKFGIKSKGELRLDPSKNTNKLTSIIGKIDPADPPENPIITGKFFSLDLHGAAPTIFPAGQTELYTLIDGELLVQRIAGVNAINGTGIRVPK